MWPLKQALSGGGRTSTIPRSSRSSAWPSAQADPRSRPLTPIRTRPFWRGSSRHSLLLRYQLRSSHGPHSISPHLSLRGGWPVRALVSRVPRFCSSPSLVGRPCSRSSAARLCCCHTPSLSGAGGCHEGYPWFLPACFSDWHQRVLL